MIQTFLGGALSGMIVVLTGLIILALHRIFPDPEPYDWPRWSYRLYFALTRHGRVHGE